MPSSQLMAMIILDQDHFSIEVILSISETLRALTTSDEDGLRIELTTFDWNVQKGYLR